MTAFSKSPSYAPSQSVAFNPASSDVSVPNGLLTSIFFVEVFDAETITEASGKVSQIDDKSPNNFYFSESGSDKHPVYNSTDGLMEFDGSNDSLEGFIHPTTSITTAQTLPDGMGAVTDKGFTGTGLALRSDGTFWAGNDGRGAPADTTHEPSIVHLSADGSTILDEIDVSAIEATATSVQDVTIDTSDDSLWFCLPDENLIINIDDEGTEQSRFSYTNVHGLAYYPEEDHLFILRDSGVLRRINQAGTTQDGFSITLSGSNWDKLHYDAERNGLWITQGANGSDGNLYFFDIASESLSEPLPLVGADAIEGVVIEGNTAWILNDAYFHTGSPALNRLLRFNIEPFKVRATSLERDAIDFTCAFKINNSNTSADAIFTSGNPLSSEGFGFYIISDTTVRCFVHDGSNSRASSSDITVDDMNTLSVMNFIVDINAETFTVYQNNVQKGSVSFDGSLADSIKFTRMQIADSPDGRNSAIDVKACSLSDSIHSAEDRAEIYNQWS